MSRSPETLRIAAAVVVPTRSRPSYLEVALASIAPQAAAAGAELLVVDDGGETEAVRRIAAAHGARYLPLTSVHGLNAARNAGVAATSGELVVFVDDDIEAHAGWLQALIDAATAASDGTDVFTGPVRARLEGRAPRSCGREGAPITTLDLGERDADTPYAWGANMAIRRAALERIGPFDTSIEQGGDESQWQDRLRAAGGGRARYVAAAAVDHRRSGDDARLRALAATGWRRGRAARRYDRWRGEAKPLPSEALLLARNLGHVVRYACPAGLVSAAQAAGRLREAATERGRPTAPGAGPTTTRAAQPTTPADDFLSGASGTVGGLGAVRRALADAGATAADVLSGRRARLAAAARRDPSPRSVLVLGVQRPEHAGLAGKAHRELRRSRHHVEMHFTAPGGRGKFENLNALLAAHPAQDHDWLLVLDDDVRLPRGFLDRFLFLAERFDLSLAQPAHRLHSHAAWDVTRRRRGSAVRETAFVEIGPVTAFAAATYADLLPFPPLRMGWGLDVHWAAIARSHGWRCGVVDAVAIGHRAAPAAASYPREQAIAEAREFLHERPYLRAAEAQRTLATHRRW